MLELESWTVNHGHAIKAKNKELGGEIWEPHRRWAYNLQGSRPSDLSDIRDKHYRVNNVMLVQRRGKFHERVAIGQIDKISWNKGNPVEETILLV
jgi:hypothetical protein